MKILVVEDDPQMLDFLERVLVSDGHDVSTAARGSEAIQRALVQDFDLMLCDIMLPDLKGTEIIRAIKAQAPSLPVIAVSALDPSDWEAQVLDAGAACYIQKPLRLVTLRREVKMVQQARANLRVLLIDGDSIHRTRLTKDLEAVGCVIHSFADDSQALTAVSSLQTPSLVVTDAAQPRIIEIVQWAHQLGVAVFVISDGINKELEEKLMRAGASLFLAKPVDRDQFMTQAQFLSH